MTAVLALIALVLLTAVHEMGHWLAVKLRGGRVLALVIGWGTPVYRSKGQPRLRVGILPLGGRIDYSGIPEGTGQAVVAVSGAVANLGLAFAGFLAGAYIFGIEGFAPGQEPAGTLRFALEATSAWFWVVPGTIVDLMTVQQVGRLRQAVTILLELLGEGGAERFLYLCAAASALWASLNLIPIPGIGTDGWHALRSLAGLAMSDQAGRDERDRRRPGSVTTDSPPSPPPAEDE